MYSKFEKAISLFQKKQFDEAVNICKEILEVDPKNFDALHLYGVISFQTKNYDLSAELISKSVKINSKNAEAYNNLGIAYKKLEKFDFALESWNQAIKINPNFAEAYNNRGLALVELKKLDESLESWSKAIEINPNFAEPHNNQGNVLTETKKYNEALSCYNNAIKINPNFADAYNNKANILKEFKKYNEAIECCNLAIKIKPENAKYYYNRAIIQKELKQLDMAIESCNLAIKYKTNYAEAYNNRGHIFAEQKKYDEAVDSFSQALNINPDINYLLSSLVHTKNSICNWKSYNKDLDKLRNKILKKENVCSPFPALTFFDSLELQNITTQNYVKTKYSNNKILIPLFKKHSNKKIRIGYYSADFRNHAMSFLLANLYELHDKTKFELIAFSFGPEKKDEMYYRISQAFDQFIDVRLKKEEDIVKLSRELNIDIAIDLMGFTQYHRFGIFTKRCAPLQVNFLGYPGTSGSNCFDYIIADKSLIQEKNQKYYSEKIIYLPDTYQVNDSEKKISDKIFKKNELGLPEDGFIFCCFNQNSKITPNIFDIWMNLLKKIDNSILWILPENQTAAKNLQKEASKRNVNPDRIIFAQRMKMSDHLARHKAADLFIDTFPYTAHTTASDALWAGLPILTLMGESFASRVAGSLLNAIGLPELITHTKNEYENKACELASNQSLLNEIKNKLNKNRLIKPLFNTKLFTKNLEKAFLIIYQGYLDNIKPHNIEIK